MKKKLLSFCVWLLCCFCFTNVFSQSDSTRSKRTNETDIYKAPRKLLLHKMDPDNFNFGIGLDANFNLIGTQFGNRIGQPMPRFSVFFSKPLNKYYINSFISMWDYSIEPIGITMINSREKNTDNQYGAIYYEPSFLLQLVPDRNNSDFKVLFGARPSYLLYTYSAISENGQYTLSQSGIESNRNKVGEIDFSGLLGLSIKFSQIGTFELKYLHSFTNNNTNNYISGRPSLLEFGIKLSAVQIGKVLFDSDLETQKKVLKLNQGTLLVMLPTPNQKAMNLLKESGRKSEIFQIELDQIITNEMVINSFKNQYQFSKVLFFSDTLIGKVLAKNFTNVFYGEKNTQSGLPENFDTTNYLIASFCEDVSEYTNKFTYGLHIYDQKLNPMPKPFNNPKNDLGLFAGGDILAYMKKRKMLYSREEYEEVVKSFNQRLQKIKLQFIENQ